MRGLAISGCIALLLLVALPATADGGASDAAPGAAARGVANGVLGCPEDIVDCVDCQPKLLPIETIFESLEDCVLSQT